MHSARRHDSAAQRRLCNDAAKPLPFRTRKAFPVCELSAASALPLAETLAARLLLCPYIEWQVQDVSTCRTLSSRKTTRHFRYTCKAHMFEIGGSFGLIPIDSNSSGVGKVTLHLSRRMLADASFRK